MLLEMTIYEEKSALIKEHLANFEDLMNDLLVKVNLKGIEKEVNESYSRIKGVKDNH